MILALLALAAAAAPDSACTLDLATDAPFANHLPDRAGHVAVLVELWAEGAPAGWAETQLDAAISAGIPVTVVLPLRDVPPAEDLALARRAAEHDLEVAVTLPESIPLTDPVVGPKRVRAALAPYRDAAPVETVLLASPTRMAEAILGKAGIHQILPTNGAPTAAPRLAAVFEGLPRTNVVLQGGPYAGPCGPDPRVGPFGVGAADRATQAIFGAIGTDPSSAPFGTVRVALRGAAGSPSDGAVLARWSREVLAPAGVRPTLPSAARAGAREALADGPIAGASTGAGRLVPVTSALDAARVLADAKIQLPRSLPGGLDLTEAFLALQLYLAGRVEGDMLRVPPGAGPATRAQSTLPGPVSVPREKVVALATALLAEKAQTLPAAVPVGGQLLTAPELLVLLASAATGADPATTVPIESPEPNARGLGWGDAGLP